MITIIRKNLITSRALKIIVWTFIIMLVASLGVPGFMSQMSHMNSWAVKVNGEAVAGSDFLRKAQDQETQLQFFRQQFGAQADVFLQSMGVQANPKNLALEVVIRDELVNQVVRDLKLTVHPDYVAKKMNDFYFVRQDLSDLVPYTAITESGISMSRLNEHLRRMQLSISDFEERVEKAVLRSMVFSLVNQAEYVPLFEKNNVDAGNSKKFSYVTLSFDDALAQEKKAVVSDSELQAFFDAQNRASKRYEVAEKRSGVVWHFSPSTYGIHVDDSTLETYYNAHKATLFLASDAQIEVRRILFKIKDASKRQEQLAALQKLKLDLAIDPQLFAQKARELSDDVNTKNNGGLMTPFARGSHEAAFDRAAFLLEKDGDISSIVETSQGFEIIQRVSKKAPTFKSFVSVKKEIREKLEQEVFSAQFSQDISALADRSNAQEAIATFAATKNAKKTAHDDIKKGSSDEVKALFSIGEAGKVVLLSNNAEASVVLLTQIKKASIPALETIKSRVTEDLYSARANESIKKVAQEIRAELSEQKTLEMVAKDHKLAVAKTEAMSQHSESSVAGARAQGLPVETMVAMEKEGLVIAEKGKEDWYVVRLNEIASSQGQEAGAKKLLEEHKLPEQAHMLEKGFVASLHRNATIKINQTFINI